MPNGPIKLLLADDSVVIQKLVGLSFANEDIEIITVDNGDDAVTRAVSSKPDIVLADVVMPGKSGYEVCAEIRGNAELANTPVLLLTGTFEAFDEGRASEVGATGHITKPFEAQALVDRVNEILATQRAAAAAPADQASSDFFDENSGELGLDPSTAQTNPMPRAKTGAIDDGLGLDLLGDAMGGDQTVALMPDTDIAAPDASAVNAPATSSPDQTMLIDDFLGADAPEAVLPEATAPESAPIGVVKLASIPAPNPLDDIDPFAEADDFDLAGLSFDDGLPMDSSPQSARTMSGDETMLADDLFGDDGDDQPVSDTPHKLASTPAPPAPSSSQGLDIDFGGSVADDSMVPDNANDYDVSASDLQIDPMSDDSSWGHGVPTGVITGPAPIVRPHGVAASPTPEPADADEFDASPGLDADWEPPAANDETSGDPMEEPTSEPHVLATPEPVPTIDFGATQDATDPEPAPSVTPASLERSTSTDLSPDMRDRIHDTLEKVAWEAFSELSDDLVKQLVDRVEQIAWEVIPQMAETLIKAEIRKMKGEEGEDA